MPSTASLDRQFSGGSELSGRLPDDAVQSFSYHESGEGDDRMTLDMFLKIARIDGADAKHKRRN